MAQPLPSGDIPAEGPATDQTTIMNAVITGPADYDYEVAWELLSDDSEDDELLSCEWLECLSEETLFFRSHKNPYSKPGAHKKVLKRPNHESVHQRKKCEKKLEQIQLHRPVAYIPPYTPPSPPERTLTPVQYYTPPTPVATTPIPAPAPVHSRHPKSGYELELEVAIRASREAAHESGITFGQINDMLNRDLTPEDYELLLLLDSTVSKKTTSQSTLKSLTERVARPTDLEESCPICMLDYEEEDKLTELPCSHSFHANCIGVWLGEHSQSCPLCNASVV